MTPEARRDAPPRREAQPAGPSGAELAALREAAEREEALQGHLAGIQEQMGYLGALLQELERARATLEALQGMRRGEEVLLPVGGGNFVRASLADEGKVLSSVGSGYSVEGPVGDALRRVEASLAALREAAKRLEAEADEIVGQIEALAERASERAG